MAWSVSVTRLGLRATRRASAAIAGGFGLRVFAEIADAVGGLGPGQRFNQSGDHLLAVLPFDVGDLTRVRAAASPLISPIVWMMAPRSVALSSAETFVSGAGRGPPATVGSPLSIL